MVPRCKMEALQLLRRIAALLTIAAVAAGCAAIEPARMQLPDELSDRSEVVELRGLGSGRQGSAELLGQTLAFERSASRLALFGDFSIANRAALRYSLTASGGESTAANCSVSRRTMAIGIVEWAAQPLTLQCEFAPSGTRLEMQESRPPVGTLKVERRGRLVAVGRTLTVRSVHQAEGAMIELAQPVGYLIEDGGRVLAAVDVANSRRPRFYLPMGDPLLRQASLQALLALALMWDATDR